MTAISNYGGVRVLQEKGENITWKSSNQAIEKCNNKSSPCWVMRQWRSCRCFRFDGFSFHNLILLIKKVLNIFSIRIRFINFMYSFDKEVSMNCELKSSKSSQQSTIDLKQIKRKQAKIVSSIPLVHKYFYTTSAFVFQKNRSEKRKGKLRNQENQKSIWNILLFRNYFLWLVFEQIKNIPSKELDITEKELISTEPDPLEIKWEISLNFWIITSLVYLMMGNLNFMVCGIKHWEIKMIERIIKFSKQFCRKILLLFTQWGTSSIKK